jgi:hypothetical protein
LQRKTNIKEAAVFLQGGTTYKPSKYENCRFARLILLYIVILSIVIPYIGLEIRKTIASSVGRTQHLAELYYGFKANDNIALTGFYPIF